MSNFVNNLDSPHFVRTDKFDELNVVFKDCNLHEIKKTIKAYLKQVDAISVLKSD